MSIKTWILITINGLLVAVVLVLSISFYNQFQNALNERVMLQLNSIKTIKCGQIEDFILREWKQFLGSEGTFESIASDDLLKGINADTLFTETGIYDLTYLNSKGEILLAFFDSSREHNPVKLIDHRRIQDILLERAGMGQSGETYLVGDDYRLRSQSRFFPEQKPYGITAKTIGVVKGLTGINGHDVFSDYRGIEVFSAFQPIKLGNVRWVILSEMDVEEVMIPLGRIQNRLLLISSVIILVTLLFSLYLTKLLTRPIVRMQKSLKAMASGNYHFKNDQKKYPLEINEMFSALEELQKSLSGAVDFSVEIGKMNLDTTYTPQSPQDLLGQSLLKMKEQLIQYRASELQNTLTIKKKIIERQETERKRLSMELHDGIGPLLTSLKLYVQNNVVDPTKRNELKKLVDETVSEIRLITYALMPPTLIDFGIGRTLENFVQSVQQTSPIDIHFEDLTLHEESSISANLGINIFRICQELINNTIKHAGATRIVITLSEFDTKVSLFYFDNGRGYDESQVVSGAGIINIKERVGIFNGTMAIHSEEEQTQVEIELPIDNDNG